VWFCAAPMRQVLHLLRRIFIWLLVGLASAISATAEPLPRSVLIVAQWDPDLPWYEAWSSAFHATLRTTSPEPVTVYAEGLDLSRFHGVLLVLAPLASLSLAGQEHGRTIPLADVMRILGHMLNF
jgi:hypothetical protein